jgi:hypothetical protein
LDENLFRLITTFDEVPPSPRTTDMERLAPRHTFRIAALVLT